jgi:nicotinate-nucleotide adenylyltransferase
MAKIGIYGGSFNPPHLGHIQAAREFRRALDLDLMIFVPAAQPPHKDLAPDSPDAETRLELVKLAARDLPWAKVDDLELQREGASYTVDTVKQLREAYPKAEFILYLWDSVISNVVNRNPGCPALIVEKPDGMRNVQTFNLVTVEE